MQISVFDGKERLKITKPIRLIELFGGIGSQSKALRNIGAKFEHYCVCEFDKYAIASYNAIHGTNFSTSDITKLKGSDLNICDVDKFCYIMTYSFPCQDLSIAGKQGGMDKHIGTRSGLLWEVERLLKEMSELPQILVMENVPQVHGKKNIANFAKWLETLEKLGYKNYYQDLNAKDYTVAQNRNRTFMVSVLGDYRYEFPKAVPLEKRLINYLEDVVDKKYYLGQEQVKNMTESNFNQRRKHLQTKDVCDTLCARDYKEPKCIVVGNLNIPGRLESACRVHSVNGIAPACNTCGGGGRETKIIEDFYANRKPREYSETCPTLRSDRSGLKVVEFAADGYYVGMSEDFQTAPLKDLSRTIKRNDCAVVLYDGKWVSIRKLTPRECYRLMGFSDQDFDKVKAARQSNSQCYKQAGNSIVVPVLEQIFKEML